MANKCTPKPASFDRFLITNNSQWESEICTYKKACWSCLPRLPRSLLLKQTCTFCSPGTDTSAGWTRTLSASPGRQCLEELRRGAGCVPPAVVASPGLKPWLEGLASHPLAPSDCLPTATELTRLMVSHLKMFLP